MTNNVIKEYRNEPSTQGGVGLRAQSSLLCVKGFFV